MKIMNNDLMEFILKMSIDEDISRLSPDKQLKIAELIVLHKELGEMTYEQAEAFIVHTFSDNHNMGMALLAPRLAGILAVSGKNIDESLAMWDKIFFRVREFIIQLDKIMNEVQDGQS